MIDLGIARLALDRLGIDEEGLDLRDRKVLETIATKFDGGPVGIDNLATAIGEERDTIEDVYEPYLIQQGLLMRTPRGRVATPAAYAHLGMTPPPAAQAPHTTVSPEMPERRSSADVLKPVPA